ncbi:MAG: exodeoxyribonuclease I [Pseudomonadota bacterium]
MTDFTLFWHDYETWGADPRRDRAAQFAGVRTDVDFNAVDDPVVLYCRPPDDRLPSPEACLVTGLTPQEVRARGVPEAEFFAAIEAQLSRPQTCTLGYNSMRFDDEVTRFGLYRNFFDPYAREWKNGNSRWDMIDVVRLTRALRPEGIEWPVREDGAPGFRLEDLTAANGIEHSGAHDALADVHATIAMARLVRDRQPRLYRYLFENRGKKAAADLLDLRRRQTVLHVSRRIPARLGCISPVIPLARHPHNSNSVICYDLRHDPEPLLSLAPEAVRERLFTPLEALAEGERRIGLKEIHINHCPVLVPTNTLTSVAEKEWALDMDAAAAHRQQLLAAADLEAKLTQVFTRDRPADELVDPDFALYDGFISDADRRRSDQVRALSPERLRGFDPGFEDPRLESLLFRYRARNWPETLGRGERERWEVERRERISSAEGRGRTLEAYRRDLSRLVVDTALSASDRTLLDALLDWPAEIGLDNGS